MKKMAFFHDHKFIIDGEEVYSPGKLSYQSFKRYFEYFDEVIIVSRFIRFSDSNFDKRTLTLVSGPGVYFIPVKNLSSFKALIFNNAQKEVINEIVDAVDSICCRLPSEIGLAAIAHAKKINKRYSVEVVACAFDAMIHMGTLKGIIYSGFYYYRNRRAILKSSNTTYVTSSFLQRRYPSNGLISNSSNVELPSEQQETPLVSYPALGSQVVIGLSGMLDSPHKGHLIAIKAIKALKEKGYKVKLELIGSGQNHEIEKFIQVNNLHNEVSILGSIERDKVYSWLDTIDIYIQPSVQEGLPRAVIEACSRGKPIIVSDAGGMYELIAKEFVVPKNNSRLLESKLRILIEDENQFVNQAKINFALSKKYRSEEIIKSRSKFCSNI